MKFNSEKLKQQVTLKGTFGIVSDWNNKTLGNTWLFNIMEKRFSSAEMVDITSVSTTKCKFLIFVGEFSIDSSVKIPCPYVVLSYARDFNKDQIPNEFYEKSMFFSVRDASTSNTFSFFPRISANILTLNSYKQLRQKNEISHIKLAWKNLDELKEKSIENTAYIGAIPYINDSALFIKIIQHLKKYGVITNDQFSITYDEKVIFERVRETDIVISSDYHVLLIAFLYGIPCIAINASPSIKNLMADSLMKNYCVDVNKILDIPSILSKITPKVRADMVKRQNEYLQTSRKAAEEWLLNVETRIFEVMEIQETDTPTFFVDPVILDKMEIDSKISNIIESSLIKYSDSQKMEVLERMKYDFDRYYDVATNKLKQAIEIEKIKEGEKLRKLERERLLEEQLLLEEKKQKEKLEIKKSIGNMENFEGLNGMPRSVFVNDKLKK